MKVIITIAVIAVFAVAATAVAVYRSWQAAEPGVTPDGFKSNISDRELRSMVYGEKL